MKKTFSQRESELQAFDPDTYNLVLNITSVVWFCVGLFIGLFVP